MNKPNAPKLKLAQLFEGEKIALKNEGRYFSTLSDHQGEKGRLNESHLKNLLRQHLPEKYGIGTGFIVSSRTINDTYYKHPQIDIIIYDKINNAPLYQSEAFGIYPVEIVYGYIEVKTTLNKKALNSAFSVNARVRDLAKDKVYVGIGAHHLPPRFYMFSYNSAYRSSKTQKKSIKSALETQGDAHPHGIYVLDKELLVGRIARYDPKIVELYEVEGSLAFPAFLTNITRHIETMIPSVDITSTLRLPISTSLPSADISRYLESGHS